MGEVGTLEYVRGSHLWNLKEPTLEHFHSGADSEKDSELPSHQHTMRNFASYLGEEKIEVVPVSIPRGGISFHHQNLWHGSGINKHPDQTRRAIAVHTLNSECNFREDKNITYIYGRYKLFNEIK